MSHIARQWMIAPINFVANTCESDPVDFGPFSGGLIKLPAGWDTAHIGIKVSETISETFVPIYPQTNTLPAMITWPAPLGAYALPDEVFGARQIRLWSVSNSLSSINQSAARAILLFAKG